MTECSADCLRVENLTKRYSDLTAVDSLSFDVKRGEIFGFLGPNGAGKTTSITMMCGLLRPDAGNVVIFGADTRSDDATLRTRVGACPQNVVIWPRLTCLEQLEFIGETYGLPRKVARERGYGLLAALGLSEKVDVLARKLSGGMQRRLSIALALVHDPEIVVLDEPEAGLDPQSRVLVREYVVELARQRGKTIIFTTHNMDEAERIVDRVAIIDHGRLLELDTPTALKRRIGGGDTLELRMSKSGRELEESEQSALKVAFPGATVTASSLTLRELAILERLPAVIELLRSRGIDLQGIQLRESSLEDVFIALTGRSLRS